MTGSQLISALVELKKYRVDEQKFLKKRQKKTSRYDKHEILINFHYI